MDIAYGLQNTSICLVSFSLENFFEMKGKSCSLFSRVDCWRRYLSKGIFVWKWFCLILKLFNPSVFLI